MNVRRGFFRIWVILSVIWIVTVISTSDKIMTLIPSPVRSQNDEKQFIVEAPDGKIITFPKEMTEDQVENVMRELYPSPSELTRQRIFHVALWAVSVPIISCAVWFTSAWILAGFKGNKATAKPKLPQC